VNALLIAHFYPPEAAAGATRIASLAAALGNAGHDVTVVTNFPSFPRGRFADGRRPLMLVESEGNVRTVRLFSILIPGLPGARLLHWLSSATSASLYALLTRARYDVVIISSPPITLAFPGLIAAWRHRARLVVDVRDVFPDIAIAMGVWKADSFMARAVEWLARRLYARADLIVAVTPTAISQIAHRGVDASRLVLARNAAEKSTVTRPQSEPTNGLAAIYAGNLGVATDVDVLVDAAALVADAGITIEIVGGGAQKEHLEARVRDEGVGNVRLTGSVARQDAMAKLAAADVSIVPLRKGIEESVPTKVYDSFAVGCPVIVVADGEARKEGASLGAFCTPPGDANALAATLRQLALLDRSELRRIGDAGRAALENRADRAGIMEELAARIGSLS
jgi:glycosyltransferase involved in cell wall biosynthesis